MTGADGLEGLVLRFGWLYGPGTYYARGGSVAEETRKRRNPVVGAGTGIFSFIHIDDAAERLRRRGRPRRARSSTTSSTTSRRRCTNGSRPTPRRSGRSRRAESPLWLARLVAGYDLASAALEMRGASNAKAKRELGWQPAHPSWRQGFAESLG